MRQEDRKQYLHMIPRVFVRALRDPNGNEEYELSEGEATSLLVEREAALNALGWRLWRACSQAEDILGITASVPDLADAMNAWKANAFPEPNGFKAPEADTINEGER